jgi:hypothetical protein
VPVIDSKTAFARIIFIATDVIHSRTRQPTPDRHNP